MVSKLVECVPNFSEGRNQEVINLIADAIRSTSNCQLLDVDAGPSTNRTVYTFVGPPDNVLNAALNAAIVAYEHIDMTKHKGEHPRMGALDVCPFIPLRNITYKECITLSRRFGIKLAEKLNVPIFLYGMSSEKEYRRELPQIREGEYEGLESKLKHKDWEPDFGPSLFVPKWGATAVGVRPFLIAYNVNIIGTKEQAHRIALEIREMGRGSNQRGLLQKCRAIGWWLKEEQLSQISMNLTDFEVTGLHHAYEACCTQAALLKIPVTGSQIVGLIPLSALLQTAEYYIKKEKILVLEESQKIYLAIQRLGLNSLSQFIPSQRIIEYIIDDQTTSLLSLSLKNFVLKVGERSPAPGGGSVAAAVAAMGAALSNMIAQLTYGKRQWEHLDAIIRNVLPKTYDTMQYLLSMVDADTTAFEQYVSATQLPSNNEEEKEIRKVAMQNGLMAAVEIPHSVAKRSNELWPTLKELADIGNIAAISDLESGAVCLHAGIRCACFNMLINAKQITDEPQKDVIINNAKEIENISEEQLQCVLNKISKRK